MGQDITKKHSEANHDVTIPRIKSVAQWIWAFTLLIGIAVLFTGAIKAARMQACGGWPVAEGVVEQSELKRGFMREGAFSQQVNVVYGFHVDGKTYKSNCISFTGKAATHSAMKSLMAAYPPGSRVAVHYAPSNPAVSVLETHISWRGFKPLAGGLLLSILGLSGLWRRWSLQTDYLFEERDPDLPLSKMRMFLGALGLVACLGVIWIWWELIKMYAGR